MSRRWRANAARSSARRSASGRELVFDYPDLSVHLTLYQAEPLTEPRALEHSALDWVGPAGLERYDLCPADRRFVPAVQQWFSEQEKAPAQQAAQRPQTGE